MVAFYFDLKNGDDSQDGTNKAPFKHHPFMCDAEDQAAAARSKLANGGYVYAVGQKEPYNAFKKELLVPKGMSGVHTTTDPNASDVAKFDYLRYHTSVADWTETSSGSNIWSISTDSTLVAAGRVWVNDVAQQQVPALIELVREGQVYTGMRGCLYIYSECNPFVKYGPKGVAFQQLDRPYNYAIHCQEDGNNKDIQFSDIEIIGANSGAVIWHGSENITLTSVNVYKWYYGGIRTIAESNTPNRNIVFKKCRAEWNTNRDEFSLVSRGRRGDSFAFVGAQIGGGAFDCVSQDCGHTAFAIDPYNEKDFRYGCHGVRISRCKGDNRNSIYGRFLSCTGDRQDFPATFCELEYNEGTNYQTRSQIGGYRTKVHHNKFWGNTGALVTGSASLPEPIRGGGVKMASNPPSTFGSKEVVECHVHNNYFGYNLGEGLGLTINGASSQHGGNQIYDNIFLANNQTPDPELSSRHHHQIHIEVHKEIEAHSEPPFVHVVPFAPNKFARNHMARSNGSIADDAVVGVWVEGEGVRGATEYTAKEFNDDRRHEFFVWSEYFDNENNSADVTLITRDGVPAPGSSIDNYGVAPPVVKSSLIAQSATDDFSHPFWGTSAGVETDRRGVKFTQSLEQIYTQWQGDLAGKELTFSIMAGGREGANPPGDENFELVLGRHEDSKRFDIKENTLVRYDFTSTVTGVKDNDDAYFRVQAGDNDHYPFRVELAFPRLAAEDQAPHHIYDEFYTHQDINGDGADHYIGAYAAKHSPIVPNLVTDDFGNSLSQEEAIELLESYLFKVGNVAVLTRQASLGGKVVSQSMSAGDQQPAGTVIDFEVSDAGIPVPDIRNMTPSQAVAAITDAGFIANVKSENGNQDVVGEVIRTEPATSTPVEPGSVVDLVISLGIATLPITTVPDLIGLSKPQVRLKLSAARLVMGKIEVNTNAKSGEQVVYHQAPAPGTNVPIDTRVSVAFAKSRARSMGPISKKTFGEKIFGSIPNTCENISEPTADDHG